MTRLTALFEALLRLPQQGLILLVRGYRLLLKPWVGNACRFEPSCSAYALEALQRHGALGGSALGCWRLLRCHPWCDGGCDPVPATFAPHPSAMGLFTRWAGGRQDEVGLSAAATAPQPASSAAAAPTEPQLNSAAMACATRTPVPAGDASSRVVAAPPDGSVDPEADRPPNPVLDRSHVTPTP